MRPATRAALQRVSKSLDRNLQVGKRRTRCWTHRTAASAKSRSAPGSTASGFKTTYALPQPQAAARQLERIQPPRI